MKLTVLKGEFVEIALPSGTILNVECTEDTISIVDALGRTILTELENDDEWFRDVSHLHK